MNQLLQLSSNWTNVINAVIFEVILITVIFYLTGDVCARLNYVALVDGSVQNLVVVSPPLLGGGIISTSRKRSMIMILIRALGIFLIFGTALTIDGETERKKVLITKQVRTIAAIAENATRDELNSISALRKSCLSSLNDTMIFGRFDVDNYCETDMDYLNNTIGIRAETKEMNFSISSSCTHKPKVFRIPEPGRKMQHVTTFCDDGEKRASIVCFQMLVNKKVSYTECSGTFRTTSNVWYACDSFKEQFSGPALNVSIPCHIATNIEQAHNLWPKAMTITQRPSVSDMLGIVSINGIENRQVLIPQNKDVTKVHNMWFLCFGIKLVIIIFFGVFSISLRLKGTRRVMNDDRALLRLLRRKLDDWMGDVKEKDSPIYLHLHTSNEGEKRVWASTVPNYNAGELGREVES